MEENCDITSFSALELYPVRCSIKLPNYSFIDSSTYDKRTILNYSIKSRDSVLDMNCFVKSYENYPYVLPNISLIKKFEKQEAEFNRKNIKLLVDTTLIKAGVEIGYLKYFVSTPIESFYEGRVFFYRDKKLVNLWLFEKYLNDSGNKCSLIDCILNNIKMD